MDASYQTNVSDAALAKQTYDIDYVHGELSVRRAAKLEAKIETSIAGLA